jgi:hypothetical protein
VTFVSNADLFCILPHHIELVVSETDPDRLLTYLHWSNMSGSHTTERGGSSPVFLSDFSQGQAHNPNKISKKTEISKDLDDLSCLQEQKLMCFHITQEYYFTLALSFVTSYRLAKRINRSRCVYPAHTRAGVAAEGDKICEWDNTLTLQEWCPSIPYTEHSRQRLMVFRKIIHVCRENHMKHFPKLHGKTRKFDG